MDDAEFKEWVTQQLVTGRIEVTFNKATGEERIMTCTLSDQHGRPTLDQKLDENRKKPNPEVCAVWDCTAQAWRSFRWDRLKGVKVLDG